MTTEVSIQLAKGHLVPKLGESFILSVGRAHLMNPGPRPTLSVRGHIVVFTDREKPTHDRWLCASLGLPGDVPIEEHKDFLYKQEKEENALWGGEIRADLWWRDVMTVKSIKVHVSKSSMFKIWSEFGDPETSGAWFAGRLLPRRVPGAVRSQSNIVQVWAKL